ncbi:mismatch-specific DNA-glycosylase [Granulicoccus sp. GXG6511]|uniref:mismatch-specific DNA-glycosylase n=1 Tax=Granulicoccus sp. GXG6511 TaxID=3381351 RepID=UPI003D7D37E4
MPTPPNRPGSVAASDDAPPAIITGRRPRRDELPLFHGSAVPDLVGPGVKLLFVGINPSLWTAAVGAHFARPGNRFWPALAAARITPAVVDCSAGMSPADTAALIARGVGITNIVARATARADELDRAELRAGGVRVMERVAELRPRVVAVLGVTAYRQAFDPKARQGLQEAPPGAAGPTEWWVLPNPSGLNAHETVASLGLAYARVAERAGIPAPHD